MNRTANLVAGAAAMVVVIGIIYRASLPGPATPPPPSRDGAQLSSRAAAVQAPSAGAAWFGDLASHRFSKDEFEDMKPTAQELKNPYTRASLYQECATYLETRGQLADDIAAANKLDPSGKTSEFVNWMAERHAARCEGVSPNDFKRVDDLMAQAAKAGEPRAQSYMLGKDVRALEKSMKTGAVDEASLKAQGAAMLSQASELVKRGDLASAEIAARLTSGRFGQGDKITSAAWMMLALQQSAQPFNVQNVGQDMPSFESLSPEEYNQALQRAQAMHANCCAHRQQM